MTSIPTSRKERADDLDALLRSPDEDFESPERISSEMKAEVRQRVSDLEQDVTSRLDDASEIEKNLDPELVARIRETSDLLELSKLVEEAKILGRKTTESLDQPNASRSISDRFRRALQGGVASTSSEAPAPVLPEEVRESVEVPVAKRESERKIEQHEEESIPPEVFRLERDLKLANATEKLEQGKRLEQEEIEMMVGALEGRGWQKLFSGVEPGDGLATFLVPNAEQFSIKRFNDVLFGMQKTDDIIKIRRDALLAEASALGLERVATSYKDEAYKVSKDRLKEEGTKGIMMKTAEAAERVRATMTQKLAEIAAEEWEGADEKRKESLDEFMESMIGAEGFDLYKEARTDYLVARRIWKEAITAEVEAMHRFGVSSEERDQAVLQEANERKEHAVEFVRTSYRSMEQARKEMEKKAILPALQKNPSSGYRMTFGVSEVREANDGGFTHIEEAVAESLAGAKLARRTVDIGSSFSKEDAEASVRRVIEIRESIGLQDLSDAEGRVYPIFEIRPDGGGKTVSVMNLDLIREVRKGTFKPLDHAKQRELFESVKEYLEAINVLDVTKPYLHEEIAGGKVAGTEQTIRGQMEQTSVLTHRLREGSISAEERKRVATLLKQDGKDRACTSTPEFHKKALEISRCSYISLDVLDVGPELLQEYELLLQRVANDRLEYEAAQRIAGDATTEKMRSFRRQVTEAYRALSNGEDPIMSVGGDEIVLAMDTAKVTDEFMLKLRQIKLSDREGGSVRVVKTAVGTGERVTESEGRETRMKEHLEAIKRAERGTTMAKEIEKSVHRIRSLINDLPRENRGDQLADLDRLNVSEFAVHQREEGDGAFELILKNPDDSSGTIRANLEAKKQELKTLEDRLRHIVTGRQQSFYDEYAPANPKLTKELVPMALRRKDQGEKGFKAFIQTLES